MTIVASVRKLPAAVLADDNKVSSAILQMGEFGGIGIILRYIVELAVTVGPSGRRPDNFQ